LVAFRSWQAHLIRDMKARIVAGIVAVAGSLIIAASILMRPGWLLASAGVVLGFGAGAVAGMLWVTSQRPATKVP